jgi:hypothetical protein
MTAPSRPEDRDRAQQIFRPEEQTPVERELAERLLVGAAAMSERIASAAD